MNNDDTVSLHSRMGPWHAVDSLCGNFVGSDVRDAVTDATVPLALPLPHSILVHGREISHEFVAQ